MLKNKNENTVVFAILCTILTIILVLQFILTINVKTNNSKLDTIINSEVKVNNSEVIGKLESHKKSIDTQFKSLYELWNEVYGYAE